MGEWASVISALFSAACAIYLATHKNRRDEFKDLEKRTSEHATKLAEIKVRLDNLENVRNELNEIRKRLDHIQEQMLTKADIRFNS